MTETLTASETRFFHDEGYLGPYAAYGANEAQPVQPLLESELFESTGPPPNGLKSRHLDSRLVYDLCTHPAILDRVAGLLGPDIVLWQSNFFNKEPGSKEIPWHQDANFWTDQIEPNLTVSAWLAIDPAVSANGCVQLLPRSHRKLIRHVEATSEHEFPEQADPNAFDADPRQVVSMELKPGQFFLFTERMLHSSAPNRSNRRRLGLAVRFTIPIVRSYKNHPVFLVSGTDRMGFNVYGRAPA